MQRFRTRLRTKAYRPDIDTSLMLDFLGMFDSGLDSRITFSRASVASYINSAGQMTLSSSGQPRFDHDPVTLARKGLLIEFARTNILLNSTIDGANLTTQSVSVTAQAYALTFYGIGSITLSGAHVAVVSGTGAFPTRTTLIFTPSAGTLTLTVAGTVQYAQLEAGALATSFIPTAGTSVQRLAESYSMTGTAFSDWYNATEGTLHSTGIFTNDLLVNRPLVAISDNSANEILFQGLNPSTATTLSFIVRDGGVEQVRINHTGITTGTVQSIASAYKVNDFASSRNGGAVGTDASGTIATPNRIDFGSTPVSATLRLGGHLRGFEYWPVRLSNTELVNISAI